jgi:hypothetical protein
LKTSTAARPMVRIGVVSALVVLGASCSSSKPVEQSVPYTSKDGRFSVVFPKKPDVGVRDAQTGGVKRKVTSALASKGSDEFGVTYSDFPSSFLADGGIKVLEKVRDTVVGDVKATLVSSNETTIGKNPALDVVANVPSGATKGEYHAKFILVGTRIYEVLVIRNDPKANDTLMRDFFDSFELTGS